MIASYAIDSATHHLHVVETKTDFWIDHLLFRDYLQAHPETVREYEAIKRNLAESIGDDRAAFTVGKSSFIEPVVARPKAWKGEDSST